MKRSRKVEDCVSPPDSWWGREGDFQGVWRHPPKTGLSSQGDGRWTALHESRVRDTGNFLKARRGSFPFQY